MQTKERSFARWALFVSLLSLALLSGCNEGTKYPLPETARVDMLDPRGIWVMVDSQGRDEPDGVLVISGEDAAGCMTVRMAGFEADGSPSGDTPREPYEPDVYWCTYQVGGLTIIEQWNKQDDVVYYEHLLVRQQDPLSTFCNIDDLLADYAGTSAVEKIDGLDLITVPSDALARLVESHAAALHGELNRDECVRLRRLIPRDDG